MLAVLIYLHKHYSCDASDTHVNNPTLPATQQQRGAQAWIHTICDNENILLTNFDIDCVTLCVCACTCTRMSSCVKAHMIRYRDQPQDSPILSWDKVLIWWYQGVTDYARQADQCTHGILLSQLPQSWDYKYVIPYLILRCELFPSHIIIPLINNLSVVILAWWPSLLTAQKGYT